jgi:molybdopterin-guanine dinucleotide biosynthesis protein A
MACDMPLLRPDIIDRLYTKLLIDKTRIAVAHDGDRLQPLCSLIHRSCLAALKRALEENKLKVVQWITEQNPAIADCSDIKDAFININTLNDIKSP